MQRREKTVRKTVLSCARHALLAVGGMWDVPQMVAGESSSDVQGPTPGEMTRRRLGPQSLERRAAHEMDPRVRIGVMCR